MACKNSGVRPFEVVTNDDVAVRSSPTAEDRSEASFSDQQEICLNMDIVAAVSHRIGMVEAASGSGPA